MSSYETVESLIVTNAAQDDISYEWIELNVALSLSISVLDFEAMELDRR